MSPLLHFLFSALLMTSPPALVSLGTPGADGCAQLLMTARDGSSRPLRSPSDELCVRDALVAHLEAPGETHLVLTVTLRHDPAQRRRLFIYTLEEEQLVPRYLGSGPAHLTLLQVTRDAAPASETLLLEVSDEQDQRLQLRCTFEGFSLLCQERAAAGEGTHE